MYETGTGPGYISVHIKICISSPHQQPYRCIVITLYVHIYPEES